MALQDFGFGGKSPSREHQCEPRVRVTSKMCDISCGSQLNTGVSPLVIALPFVDYAHQNRRDRLFALGILSVLNYSSKLLCE